MTTHRDDCCPCCGTCYCTLPGDIEGEERDWLGPKDETKHIIFTMQSNDHEKWWHCTADGIELENFSEFSVRIHDPKLRSLSFINRTIAILPKSQLRSIHALIGGYLNDKDT